jgi:uncharacterized membrane protein
MKFTKGRVDQFSDGVIAIIVTIMVLYIPLPKTFKFDQIITLLASVLVYFISFFVVGFFWHQHYRLFYNIDEIPSKVSWRNFLFLFSLSLMPIFTKWVIENFGEVIPAVGYVIVYIFVNMSYHFLFSSILSDDEKKKFKGTRKFAWLHNVIWVMVTSGTIIFSFFYPMVASVLLIGLPLIFSLTNLWGEDERRLKRREQKLAALKRKGTL